MDIPTIPVHLILPQYFFLVILIVSVLVFVDHCAEMLIFLYEIPQPC